MIQHAEHMTQHRLLHRLERALEPHSGLYDKHSRAHQEAVHEANLALAELAKISEDDVVLDAGCSSALWLAKHRGARVVGIHPDPARVEHAQQLALKHGLLDRTDFEMRELHRTGFPLASFDVYWMADGGEHAKDKRAALKEAMRVLRLKGRLVWADAFLTRRLLKDEEEAMRPWLGQAELSEWREFLEQLRAAGFRDVRCERANRHILLPARAMYRAHLAARPFGALMELIGAREAADQAQLKAARAQYQTLRSQYWGYFVFSAQK